MLEEEDPLLNATELKIIFGNLPPIYQTHCLMLEELKYAVQNWNEEVSIGNIILKFVSMLGLLVNEPFQVRSGIERSKLNEI